MKYVAIYYPVRNLCQSFFTIMINLSMAAFILKNLTTVAKLLFLLNAANVIKRIKNV